MSTKGFTLLEVLVSVAIMAISFAAILMVQSGSIQATIKAKEMTVVAMLAKNAMVQTEMALEGKKFEEVKDEVSDNFEKPFESYRWTRVIKEVEFPPLGGLFGGTSEEENQTQQTEMFGKLFTEYLTKAIREVTIKVSWEKGNGMKTYSLSTYWVDLNSDFKTSL